MEWNNGHMDENKGRLIYDASVYTVSRKWDKTFKKDQLWKATIGILIMIFVGLLLLVKAPPQTNKQAFGYFGLILFVLPLSLIFALVPLLAFFGKEYLRIYETGIVLPIKSPINTILHRENFIPFGQIEEIYSKHGEEAPLGGNPYPPYIYIKLKGRWKGTEAFHINEIGGEEHLDEFIDIVKKKVKKVNIKW